MPIRNGNYEPERERQGASVDVSHELANLLGAIVGFTDLALEDLGAEHPARKLVSKAQQAACKALALSQGLPTAPAGESVEVGPVPGPSGARILVVDDEPAMLDLMANMLARAGYTVSTAQNGRDAVEMVARDCPDLMITDIVMPEQEGIQTIIELRRVAPDLRIIAVSAGGRHAGDYPNNYLRAAEQLGAARVFSKPIDRTAFLEAVADLTD